MAHDELRENINQMNSIAGKLKTSQIKEFIHNICKWPDKSTTSYAMLDFESDLEK